MEPLAGQLFSEVPSVVGEPSLHWEMIPRLVAAAAIGAALSLRPWRLALGQELPKAEMVQAQVLLCAAAAVITAVIGNSLAKAFGLVGLGGFVRFRSGLKDPRDGAILFLVIGLGMACGHGALQLAAVGAAFVGVLLFGMDLLARGAPRKVKLTASSEDPAAAEAALRRAFGQRNVKVTASALDLAGKRIELELEEKELGGVGNALSIARLENLRDVQWAPLEPRQQKEDL